MESVFHPKRANRNLQSQSKNRNLQSQSKIFDFTSNQSLRERMEIEEASRSLWQEYR